MKDWLHARVFAASCWVLRVFFRLVYRARVEGRERVPGDGGLLVVSNHQSHFDPPFVGCWLGRMSWFVARDTLFKGALGPIIRYYNAFPIRRGEPDSGTMKLIIGHLKAGRCVVMFPEGTRSSDGEIGEFLRGVALVFRRSGCDVLPAAIDGLHGVWPRGAKGPRFGGRVAVRYGEVVSAETLKGLEADEAVALLQARVQELHASLREGAGSACSD